MLLLNTVLEIRIRNWLVIFLKMYVFYRLLIAAIENVQEIWPTKLDFGQPKTEIVWKMVNSWLLSTVNSLT